MKIFKNLPVLIAIGLILIAGIVFYITLIGVQQLVPVMAAKDDLYAYSVVKEDQLTTIKMPKKAVDDQPWLLTEDEYQKDYIDKKRPLVTTARLFKGEAIDTNRVAKVPRESLAVALPDERVVAASTTLTGSLVGTIQPGDVVDISGTDTGATSITAAKVLCVTTELSGCEGVAPVSIGKPNVDGGSGPGSGAPGSEAANVNLILAVPKDEAAAISGSTVTLVLNPYCSFNELGVFTNKRSDFKCEVPNDRIASKGIAGLEALQKSEESIDNQANSGSAETGPANQGTTDQGTADPGAADQGTEDQTPEPQAPTGDKQP